MRKVNRVNKTWLVDGHGAKQLFFIVYTCFIAGGNWDKSPGFVILQMFPKV